MDKFSWILWAALANSSKGWCHGYRWLIAGWSEAQKHLDLALASEMGAGWGHSSSTECLFRGLNACGIWGSLRWDSDGSELNCTTWQLVWRNCLMCGETHTSAVRSETVWSIESRGDIQEGVFTSNFLIRTLHVSVWPPIVLSSMVIRV